MQYLIFEVDEAYAIELSSIVEILEIQPITRVPETPDYITGVMNVRGQVVPVIDLRVRFKKPANESIERKCVIVTKFENLDLGLIVDSVSDLINIDDENISEPPQVGNDYSHIFIKAIGVYDGQMKLILDTDKVINHSDIDFLEEEQKRGGN